MNWKSRPKTKEARLYSSCIDYGFPSNSELAEDHHHYYGRAWALGRCLFETLLGAGVLPSNKVLDFGCGSGRLAIWLAKFLDKGNYYGVEAHLESVEALMRYEIPLHGIKNKCITVSHDSNINLSIFGTSFDVVVDAYASIHLSQCQLALFRSNMARHTKVGGIYVTCPEPLFIEENPISGFILERQFTSNCDLISESTKNTITNWHVYRRVSAGGFE